MKQFIEKAIHITKRIVFYTVLAGALVLIAYSGIVLLERKNAVSVEAPKTPVERVQEIVQPKTDVEQAREMLAEATRKLDAEEARLEAEIAEREKKIEEINTIRASF